MNSQEPMIDNNDPRLTAYVLGELAPADVAQIEAALKSSPKLRAVVADIRQATESISNVFLAEPTLQLTPEQKSQLLNEAESASNFDVHSTNADSTHQAAASVTPAIASEYYQPSSALSAHWLKIAVAAGLASVLIGGAYYFSGDSEQSMAEADHEVLELPSAVDRADDDAAPVVKSAAAPQAPPQTIKKEIASADDDGLEEADSVDQQAMEKLVASQPMNRSSDVLGDDASDLKFKKEDMPFADSAMPALDGLSNRANQSTAPAKADYAYNANDAANKKSELERKLPSPENSYQFETGSNLRGVALAQNALNQSELRSLNLTVVAQNDFGGVGGGGAGAEGGTGLGRPGGAPIDSPDAEEPSDAFKVAESPPATLALLISDRDAKQMVDLLASQADPGQQRKLSLDDLIGRQDFSGLTEGLKRDKPTTSYGDDSPLSADEVEKNKPVFSKNASPLASSPPPQLVAAVTLATKLREFVDRPSFAIKGETSPVPSITPGADTDDGEDLSKSSLRKKTAAYGAPIIDGGAGATLNDGMLRNQPNDLAPQEKPSTLGSAVVSESGKNQPLLGEFDFDYSQVIEQLKLKLKIRNESLPGSK